MRGEPSNAAIWSGIAHESGVGFIAVTQIHQALQDLYRLQDLFSDESDPRCLYPVGHSDSQMAYPVECGQTAERKSHSIQHANVLEAIACYDGRAPGGGPYVYQLFPDVTHTARQTAAPPPGGGRPLLAQRWPWEIEEIPPHCVTLGNASVRHFACNSHDQEASGLGRADNIVVPDLRGRRILDDHNPPPGLDSFMECLFFLAYRTLLFRISQLRGVEKAASQVHQERSAEGNRFAVKMVLQNLYELSDKLTELYRFKQGFDQRILGDSQAIHLVHHVVAFRPLIPYACAEYTPVQVGRPRREREVWVSINVLPLQGVTWLIVSHPCQRNSVTIEVGKVVDRMVSPDSRQRRRADFGIMRNSSNLCVSPKEYRLMPAEDRHEISSSMASAVFGDTLSKGLEILRSSKGGQDVIRRVEAKVRAGL